MLLIVTVQPHYPFTFCLFCCSRMILAFSVTSIVQFWGIYLRPLQKFITSTRFPPTCGRVRIAVDASSFSIFRNGKCIIKTNRGKAVQNVRSFVVYSLISQRILAILFVLSKQRILCVQSDSFNSSKRCTQVILKRCSSSFRVILLSYSCVLQKHFGYPDPRRSIKDQSLNWFLSFKPLSIYSVWINRPAWRLLQYTTF